MGEPVVSLEGAAAFVDRVGIALVFPRAGIVLPSLFEAVAGPGPVRWAQQREDGKLEFTPEMQRVWAWKDELAARRLACAGKHVRGWPALVSLALLPALYALTGRAGEPEDFREAVMPPLHREVAEAVLGHAPADSRDLRRLTGRRDARTVNRAVDALQRALVLTRVGTVQREQGWAGTAYDLLARRYRSELRRLPAPDRARAELAAAVLGAAGELSAVDLARALGMGRAEAAAALAQLAGGGRTRGPQ